MKLIRILFLVVLPLFANALMSGCASSSYAVSEPKSGTTNQQIIATRTTENGSTVGLPAPGLMRQSLFPSSVTFDRTFLDHGAQSSLIAGQTTPSREEELWVVAKYDGKEQSTSAAKSDEAPGTGSLLARLPDQPTGQPIPVPLKHTDVKADIAGYIATVGVTQQYHNPFSSKIEAIYVFPLPHNAAVNEFIMTIGDRKIRGIIRERAEAHRIYDSAKSQGYVASLLVQDRPNIFMQSVANIEPGKQIDIHITYFHTLEYSDGWYEWHFPMVVGPRFNPPTSNDGIGTVPRLAYGTSGQKTEVQYLSPAERSGHDISLAVHLDAGVKLEQLDIPSHRTNARTEGNLGEVTLSQNDSIPNKDFVLRYRVAGEKLKSALVATRDQQGGYFTLTKYKFNPTTQGIIAVDATHATKGSPATQPTK